MTTRQLALPLDAPPRPVEPRDPKVTAAEAPRLSRQCRAILEMLRASPRSNRELAGVALNYRARISDLRAAGYEIPAPVEDEATGAATYRLVEGRP